MDVQFLDKISKPDNFGPYYWYLIHSLAYRSRSYTEMNSFEKQLKRIVDTIPCTKCRIEATNYIANNPPNQCRDVVDEQNNHTGMFVWTYIFHNDVNERLGKKKLPYKDALTIYQSADAHCQHACAADN